MTAPSVAEHGSMPTSPPIAAELLLQSLSDHGVDYFFVNSGTDSAPVVEAFSRAARSNTKVPRPVLVPHENLAIAMAHGVHLMTGRPQALMVHVNVGTANTIAMLANLSRDRAPIVLMAGRNPITEKGRFGSRNRPIHWAQEMFDQGSMVREFVKWDYELRMPEQTGDVVARAFEVAMASPPGPVYLTLPREPMSETLDDLPAPNGPRPVSLPPYPDPTSIAVLADWIAAAERPLIVTSSIGRDFAATLARLVELYVIPIIAHVPRRVALPSSHPMNFGFDPETLVPESDLIIVLECDAPWFPSLYGPPAGCRVAHLGEDPAFQRYPIRSFPSNLAIAASPASILQALVTECEARLPAARARIEARRTRLAERARLRRVQITKDANAAGETITLPVLSRAIGKVFADAIIFNESALMLDHCQREEPGTLFGLSSAGGLGWALGAALGAKLAAPDKLVVATIGDGAYLFANPTVGSWVSGAYNLPIISIIFNNSRYAAVRRATLSMFKEGAAGENDGRLLADLGPSPAYEELVRVQGGFGERVERAQDLPAALMRARDAVLKEHRPALLNVICPY